MVVFNNILAGAAGQTGGAGVVDGIERSLRFNSADSAYLNRTPSSAGNQKTFTFSCWLKKSGINSSNRYQLLSSYASGSVYFTLEFETEKLKVFDGSAISGGLATEGVFRDPSAWYHIVCAVDTTDGTAANRVKLYVNGVQQTLTGTQPSQNSDLAINTTTSMLVGALDAGAIYHNLDGYLADVHFIDGQALAPTDFGEYDDNNVWQPIEYAGTYGTNGFHLDFSDNSSTTTIAEDSSGNNNDFTANNISVASGAGNDSLIDTPTNYEAASGNNGGNYATLNPLSHISSSCTFSNGNLNVNVGAGNTGIRAFSTIGMSSGKYYFEHQITGGSTARSNVGVINDLTYGDTGNPWIGSGSGDYIVWSFNGQAYNNGTGTNYGVSWTTGDIIGCAFDADNGNLYVYKNGTVMNSGTPAFTGLTDGPYFFICSEVQSNIVANFGQRPFAYTPPTGYKSLCTQNLTDPTIADGSTAFGALTYSGNGNARTLTGLNMNPDFIWIKSRSSAQKHVLVDSVRTTSTGEYLASDSTQAEGTGVHISGTTNGITIADPNASTIWYNDSSHTYVAWTWDGGTSTVSNTDGSITSNVRANPSAGFSIVEFTNPSSGDWTFGHGLNAAPEFFVMRPKGATSNWQTYHKGLTALGSGRKFLWLNSTNAEMGTNNTYWTSDPDSSVCYAGTGMQPGSQQVHIAYCFAPVEGYSAFGSYTGNGSSDGPFVYTGFKPKFILYKESSAAGEHWHIRDTSRDPINVTDKRLMPSSSNAEGSGTAFEIDVLSNGFKLRSGNDTQNFNGSTYIYAAFAEHPFKTARAR
jgi:hypothetical protein